MALRGGACIQVSMNDHTYLYANMFDKSIMYDLAVPCMLVHEPVHPRSGFHRGFILASLSHSTRPLLAAVFPCWLLLPGSPSSRLFLVRLRHSLTWMSSSLPQALSQLGLCLFVRLSTLLIQQAFIEHLLSNLYLYLSIHIYKTHPYIACTMFQHSSWVLCIS